MARQAGCSCIFVNLMYYLFVSKPIMRKPILCTCKNKDADQCRENREADQRLFCACTNRFVSDFVGNQIIDFLMTRLNFVSN